MVLRGLSGSERVFVAKGDRFLRDLGWFGALKGGEFILKLKVLVSCCS